MPGGAILLVIDDAGWSSFALREAALAVIGGTLARGGRLVAPTDLGLAIALELGMEAMESALQSPDDSDSGPSVVLYRAEDVAESERERELLQRIRFEVVEADGSGSALEAALRRDPVKEAFLLGSSERVERAAERLAANDLVPRRWSRPEEDPKLKVDEDEIQKLVPAGDVSEELLADLRSAVPKVLEIERILDAALGEEEPPPRGEPAGDDPSR